MVKPVLRSLFSSDAVEGLDKYEPNDPESFGIRVQAFVGTDQGGATDSFDFVACAPRWFAEQFESSDPRRWETGLLFANTAFPQLRGEPQPTAFELSQEPDEPVLGYGFVFMRRWDYARLEQLVQRLCDRLEGPTWGSVASRLGRYLPWEFDYKYDRALNEGAEFP